MSDRNLQMPLKNVPELDRLNYFYGQMLGQREYKLEQSYFLEKHRLHNRFIHGHGVVFGLDIREPLGNGKAPGAPREVAQSTLVEKVREELGQDSRRDPTLASVKAPSHSEQEKPSELCQPLLLTPGMGIDPEGNELFVRNPFSVPDIKKFFTEELKKKARDPNWKGGTIHLSLCYHPVGMEPARPVLADACIGSRQVDYMKFRDGVCLKIDLKEPTQDERCHPGFCQESDLENCVYLAKIENYSPNKPIIQDDIHPEVRRPLCLYPTTRIKSINWRHGYDQYTLREANSIIQKGLEISFTKPVIKNTLVDGIFDLFIYPKIDRAQQPVQVLTGEIEPLGVAGEQADGVRFRHNFDYGKHHCDRITHDCRIHIVFRSAFVLDRCCQPVDGVHVGGWVPTNGEPSSGRTEPCHNHRGKYGPWTSGVGVPGGNFESWFFVQCGEG